MSRGFSLLEVCLVIFLMTLLLGTFLQPLAARTIRNSEIRTTLDLEEAKIALAGFAITHRRLPCPGDGFEQPCGVQVAEGTLPWKTLGLSAGTDRFGNPLFYRVDPAYTTQITMDTRCSAAGAISFKGPTGAMQHEDRGESAGSVCIIPETGSCTCPTPAPRPVAVIFSAGANGQLEGENAVFRAERPVYQDSGDDLTIWMSPVYLRGWMNRAGKLP